MIREQVRPLGVFVSVGAVLTVGALLLLADPVPTSAQKVEAQDQAPADASKPAAKSSEKKDDKSSSGGCDGRFRTVTKEELEDKPEPTKAKQTPTVALILDTSSGDTWRPNGEGKLSRIIRNGGPVYPAVRCGRFAITTWKFPDKARIVLWVPATGAAWSIDSAATGEWQWFQRP
jgi:hypothetical protein